MLSINVDEQSRLSVVDVEHSKTNYVLYSTSICLTNLWIARGQQASRVLFFIFINIWKAYQGKFPSPFKPQAVQ